MTKVPVFRGVRLGPRPFRAGHLGSLRTSFVCRRAVTSHGARINAHGILQES